MDVYGVDLAGLYTGALTPRRCWLLIEQLPPGSRLARAVGGDGAWTMETHAVVSMLTAVRSDLAGRRVPSPEPPEPGWRLEQDRDAARASRIARM